MYGLHKKQTKAVRFESMGERVTVDFENACTH